MFSIIQCVSIYWVFQHSLTQITYKKDQTSYKKMQKIHFHYNTNFEKGFCLFHLARRLVNMFQTKHGFQFWSRS